MTSSEVATAQDPLSSLGPDQAALLLPPARSSRRVSSSLQAETHTEATAPKESLGAGEASRGDRARFRGRLWLACGAAEGVRVCRLGVEAPDAVREVNEPGGCFGQRGGCAQYGERARIEGEHAHLCVALVEDVEMLLG